MDITFKTGEGRFNYRVAGLLIHDNKILIMQDENSPYFYTPGGRVALHESSELAIKREIKEELGIDVSIKRLLWIVESFFVEDRNKEKFHEIAFYYLLTLSDESILEKGDEFVLSEGGKHTLKFTWQRLDEIQDLYLYPNFLKKRILNLPTEVEHIVEYE